MTPRRGIAHRSLLAALTAALSLTTLLGAWQLRQNEARAQRRRAELAAAEAAAQRQWATQALFGQRGKVLVVPRVGIPCADGVKRDLEDLAGRELRGVDLRGASWPGAQLRGTRFTECDLRGSDLRGADLAEAVFSRCDLRGANLVGADLRDAHFGWSDVRGALLLPPREVIERETYSPFRVALEGATYDSRTRWPEGFDPKAAGATLEE